MNFLNPLFLALLAAAAIPLVIHLFSRRKVREVRFSTLRFLALSDRRSMRRINLRRLILLALRMAAIALVALACFAAFVIVFAEGQRRRAQPCAERGARQSAVRHERGRNLER